MDEEENDMTRHCLLSKGVCCVCTIYFIWCRQNKWQQRKIYCSLCLISDFPRKDDSIW